MLWVVVAAVFGSSKVVEVQVVSLHMEAVSQHTEEVSSSYLVVVVVVAVDSRPSLAEEDTSFVVVALGTFEDREGSRRTRTEASVEDTKVSVAQEHTGVFLMVPTRVRVEIYPEYLTCRKF